MMHQNSSRFACICKLNFFPALTVIILTVVGSLSVNCSNVPHGRVSVTCARSSFILLLSAYTWLMLATAHEIKQVPLSSCKKCLMFLKLYQVRLIVQNQSRCGNKAIYRPVVRVHSTCQKFRRGCARGTAYSETVPSRARFSVSMTYDASRCGRIC